MTRTNWRKKRSCEKKITPYGCFHSSPCGYQQLASQESLGKARKAYGFDMAWRSLFDKCYSSNSSSNYVSMECQLKFAIFTWCFCGAPKNPEIKMWSDLYPGDTHEHVVLFVSRSESWIPGIRQIQYCWKIDSRLNLFWGKMFFTLILGQRGGY